MVQNMGDYVTGITMLNVKKKKMLNVREIITHYPGI